MRLRAAAGIIALIIFGGFILSVPRTRDGNAVPKEEVATVTTSSVTLRDTYKKGVHTISGSLEVPNACVSASAEASAVGGADDASGILVAITLTSGEGVCLQLPTQVKFSTTVSAPAALPLTATVNGVAATTTVL